MAGELVVKASLEYRKSGIARSIAKEIARDVAGTIVFDNIQTVGTSEEAILLGDVGVGGYMLAVNLDTTNYVQLKSATGVTPHARLLAGDIALYRLDASATAPFAQANTGACDVQFFIIKL